MGEVVAFERGEGATPVRLGYRGYHATPQWSEDDRCWHGRLEGIRDVISFEADGSSGLSRAFREAVDDYLNLCARRGDAPEPPRATGDE